VLLATPRGRGSGRAFCPPLGAPPASSRPPIDRAAAVTPDLAPAIDRHAVLSLWKAAASSEAGQTVTSDETQAPAARDRGPSRSCIRDEAAATPDGPLSMQRDSGAPWDAAPWEVHAIAATPSPRSPSRCLLLNTPPRPRWPRAPPASLPRSCAFWTTTLERQHPQLPRFPAPGQRPPSPPSPFSSFLFCFLISWTHPRPSESLLPSTTNLPSCLGPDPAHEPPW
jgi:hypothetical protein